MYVNHVSFQDLSPSLIDDQAKSLKKSPKSTTSHNSFIHIPPQFNPLYSDVHERDGSRGESISGDGTQQDSHLKRPGLSLDSGTTRSQQDLSSRTMLGRTMSNDYSENETGPFLGRTKTGFSSLSSTSTSLTRAPTSSSGPRLPPPLMPPVLKHTNDEVSVDDSIANLDLTEPDPAVEKQIEKVTNTNTQENSGNKFGSGFTTSAFSNLNEPEDKLKKKKEQIAQGKVKKKSYVDMTDEELAEMEAALQSGGRETHADMSNFDFGQQSKVFIGDSSSRTSLASKITNAVVKTPEMTLNYPSRPTITHKAISITREHVDYRRRYGSEAEMRTVVCFLNGRKHTWATADWFTEQAARDGDHLVIVSNLPMYEELLVMLRKNDALEQTKNQSKLDQFSFDGKIKNKIPSAIVELPFHQIGLMISELDELTRCKCESLIDYYSAKCKDKVMKITIELVKASSTPKCITHVLDLYRPNFLIVSTISTNLSIKFKNGHVKLPNFLYRHFWVPTIIIPYEFIDPYILGEAQKPKALAMTASSKQQVLSILDKCINKSLNDALGTTKKGSTWRAEDSEQNLIDGACNSNENSDGMESIDSEDDEGITDYFPSSPEAIKKKQQIDKLGYIPPTPSRFEPNSLGAVASRNSSVLSRRSSRVYFTDEPGMYKVKSLLTDYSDDTSSVGLRGVKSDSQVPTISSKRSSLNTKSPSSSKQQLPPTAQKQGSKPRSPKPPSKLPKMSSDKKPITQVQKEQKPKLKLGGVFKKLLGK